MTGRGRRFFSSPGRPDRFWSQLSLPVNGYRVPARGLSRHLDLVSRLRICGVIHPLPLYTFNGNTKKSYYYYYYYYYYYLCMGVTSRTHGEKRHVHEVLLRIYEREHLGVNVMIILKRT